LPRPVDSPNGGLEAQNEAFDEVQDPGPGPGPDSNPHLSEKLDSDPHLCEKLVQDPH
jgi:hypothetical protein